MEGHLDVNGSFLVALNFLESLAVLSSRPPFEPLVWDSELSARVLLQPVETTKNSSDEGGAVANGTLARRGSESHL